ncbi:MAG TPA: hypothetical protein PKC45_06130 [Gemmatales bacterium]|nr:hypothetical protein [Gemmatales bacterium]
MASDAEILAYVLRGLDEDEAVRVEGALEQNNAARQRLVGYRRFLQPLEADGEPPPAPANLYIDTLRRVAELRSRRATGVGGKRMLEPAPRDRDVAVGRSRWRRADVAVAAIVLFAIGLLLPSAILHLRREQAKVACADNLRRLFPALQDYADRHGGYLPEIPTQEPYNIAGMYAVALRSDGVWRNDAHIHCPSNVAADRSPPPLTAEELRARVQSAEGDSKWAQAVGGCYAYNLGYWTPSGPRPVEPVNMAMALPKSCIPVLADRPPRNGESHRPLANSPNHGYRGQNVLFLDGSVQFLTVRSLLQDDDIYLNRKREMAPGLDPTDAVLGLSETRIPVQRPGPED